MVFQTPHLFPKVSHPRLHTSTAGYLPIHTRYYHATRLIPNRPIAGYLGLYTNKNTAKVNMAIAGYLSVYTVNNRTMLLVWTSLLVPQQQAHLRTIDPRVCFWPRSWQYSLIADYAVPAEWWISFSHTRYGLVWILHHPLHSHIIYRD